MSRESGAHGYSEANALSALPHLTPTARPGRFALSPGAGKSRAGEVAYQGSRGPTATDLDGRK
jgi:hypothetical protein